jgi:transcriptional regulator with XRE-family HTH domain
MEKIIGINIKKLIEIKGVNQYAIAELTKKSHKTVSSWVTGKSEPNPEDLYKISRYFGITSDILMYQNLDKLQNQDDLANVSEPPFEYFPSNTSKKVIDVKVKDVGTLEEVYKLLFEESKKENEKLRGDLEYFKNLVQQLLNK